VTKPAFSRQSSIVLLAVILFLGTVWVLKVRAADDLDLWVGEKKSRVDSRDNRGKAYFELRDLVEILNLRFQESDTQATVSGPRGQLQLTNNRPLVRFKDEYILLNQAIWRRKEKEWYVPEDFLQKALPLILAQRLERQSALSYRVVPFEQNRVQVEVTNFPDHVRLTFIQSRQAPIRVQEFQDSIRVTFDNFLVIPSLPATRPDSRIVGGLQFDSTDVYGAFRIDKGQHYYNFREYSSDRSDRKVIDLYSPPATARTVPEIAPQPQEPTPTPAPAPPVVPAPVPVFKARQFGNLVTLDPGHGGEDYGVHPSQEELEKNYTLRIAERIEARLRSTAYRGMLTRTQDTDLAASHRSAIANYYQSRCYIGIHLGGAPSKETAGPVVYVQRYSGQDRQAGDEESGGADGSTPIASAREMRPQNLIPWEMGQTTFVTQSKRLGELIQSELNAVYGTENQLVEVPLAQLAPVAAPAVIVEAGFLTNSDDQQKLATGEFQDRIAVAIVKAIQRFLN